MDTTEIILNKNIEEEIAKHGEEALINGVYCQYVELKDPLNRNRIITKYNPCIDFDVPVLIKNKRVKAFYTVEHIIQYCNGFVVLELKLIVRDIAK
jgi:hypothetical protein